MSKLDLLLVNPGKIKKKVYQDLSEDYSAIEPPFWTVLTGTFINNKGFNAEIIDANAENLTHEETIKKIEEKNPYLTNIVVYGQHPSASTQMMTSVGELCKNIKKTNQNRKIILTGLHPSALPERTLKEENCDYVCQGEGFYTLEGLLKKNNLEKIPGLWWKKKEKIFHNPRAENINNLTSALKDVDWNLLDLNNSKYRAHNWQCLDDFSKRNAYISISTSLGCPFTCDFCSIHEIFGERKVRYWEPEWVVDQIENLNKNHNIKIFKIIDEMFILNPKHYIKIAEGLIEKALGKEINIWAYARVDTIKEEYLKKLKKAGFKWLAIGFESGNEDILKEVHKGNFTKKDMIEISKKIKDAGINILGNYMFGFPNETFKSMQETLDLAIEQNCEFANFYCTTAWPGSKLYNEVVKKKIELPNNWLDFAQHSYEFKPLPSKFLSAEQILEFRDKAFNEYFTNKKYINMIEKKFGNEAKEHIKKMTQYKLKRKILER